ncbi:unnamed protein product [Brachionus calyciflorus]|uniref:GATOR complex protein NPRL3 n=1 Tax=Brachionus calyciflorus TaxID=104777 RepID=A0A813WV85_9BILA|nr:unnamed protein product [Brachionus calyciflorus]
MDLTSQSDSFEVLGILLVSHGSSGSHLLFKYPFNDQIQLKSLKNTSKKSAYSTITNETNNLWLLDKGHKSIINGLLCGLNNDVLASLCQSNNEQLELKIDNVFFLGSKSILKINQVTFNIVFALKSPLPRPAIKCYQMLSLAISKSLLKEETNSGYLTQQSRILVDFIDEHQNIDENNRRMDSSFSYALDKCILAQEIKTIYESIKKNGIVNLYINNCVNLSFCLPHLAYRISGKCEQSNFVEVIFDSFKYLKPYFGILLLTDRDELLKSLPVNCNQNAKQLIEKYNPLYSLSRYAAELDLPIEEVYAIVEHLIYWAKIKVIYPIDETNFYILNPNAQLNKKSKISQEFKETFDNASYHFVLSLFSEAKTLSDHLDPRMSKEQHNIFFHMLEWLLQRNVLIQLHNYIFLMPKKFEHHRLGCEKYSKHSDISYDDDSMNDSRLENCAESENSNDTENTDHKNSCLSYDEFREVLTECKISEKDQQYIFKAFESRHPDSIKQFMQLVPYFNGQSNLEEIIYHEKLNRSDLYILLDKFKDMLFVSTYEDPNPLIRINVKI